MTLDARIDRLDPRLRVVACVAGSVLLAAARQRQTLIAALVLTIMLLLLARVRPRAIASRLVGVNVFVLMLLVTLPLTAPDGLRRAIDMALRANAIVILITAMLATMTLPTLGHAMHHLKVPAKLVHLMLLCVRYVDLLRDEHRRLRTAMKVRGFRPGMNRHTYRSFGYLIGMLLVRSFDRAERVAAAMKCRGYDGRLHLLEHFHARRHDAVFAVLLVTALAALICMEWA